MIVFRLTFLSLLIFSTGLSAQIRKNLDEQIQKLILHETEIVPIKQNNLIVMSGIGDSLYYYQYGMNGIAIRDIPRIVIDVGDMSMFLKTTWLLNSKGMQNSLDLNINEALGIDNPYFAKMTVMDLIGHKTMLPKQVPPAAEGEGFRQFLNSFSYPKQDDHFLYSHFNEAILDTILSKDKSYPENMIQYFKDSEGLSSAYIQRDTIKMTLGDICTIARRYIINDYQMGTPEKIKGYKNQLQDQRFAAPWLMMKPKKYFDIYATSSKTTSSKIQMGFVKETRTFTLVYQDSSDDTQGLYLLILRMLNRNWKK